MMTEVQPETQATEEHVGFWVLMVTDGKAYSLPQDECGLIFNSEAHATSFAVELLVHRNYVRRDESAFVMDGNPYDSEKAVLEAYQWTLAGLDSFHVYPAFNGELMRVA